MIIYVIGLFFPQIFQYLELRDLLNCAEVCCTWTAVIQSGPLWSQVCTGRLVHLLIHGAVYLEEHKCSLMCVSGNFSLEKDWITDCTVRQILQNYRPFVTHLNLRGCTSLKWPSVKCISEYFTFCLYNTHASLRCIDTDRLWKECFTVYKLSSALIFRLKRQQT